MLIKAKFKAMFHKLFNNETNETDKIEVFNLNKNNEHLVINIQNIINYIINIINRCKTNKYYCLGITKNPEKRIKKHHNKNNLKYLYTLYYINYHEAKQILEALSKFFINDYHYLNNFEKLYEKTYTHDNKYYIYIAFKSKINDDRYNQLSTIDII